MKLADIKTGDILVADGGFECMEEFTARRVENDPEFGLYIPCTVEDHIHKISGPSVNGEIEVIGFTKIGWADFLFFWNGLFSQWQQSPIEIEGVHYNCCEQYMMAQKALLFEDTSAHSKIMASFDPRYQKSVGRTIKNFDVDAWNAVCRDIVYTGNYAKFTQNELLKQYLLNTGDKIIVEASYEDRIWGIGFDQGDPAIRKINDWGSNWLGKAIMQVRRSLRGE